MRISVHSLYTKRPTRTEKLTGKLYNLKKKKDVVIVVGLFFMVEFSFHSTYVKWGKMSLIDANFCPPCARHVHTRGEN